MSFKRLIASSLVSVLLLCSVASTAAALTLNVFGGQLFGASNVNVGGTLYNVEFIDSTCSALYSGCDSTSDFPFTTQASATLAAQALLDQVFIDGPLGLFDSDVNLTNGCDGPPGFGCWVLTPFAPNSGSVLAISAFNRDGPGFGLTNLNSESISGTSSISVWAVWSATVVPEPSTALLLGMGLAILALSKHRRTRVAN